MIVRIRSRGRRVGRIAVDRGGGRWAPHRHRSDQSKPHLLCRQRNRGKTRGVIAGLVPAISIRMAQCQIIGMAGTSPAMTKRELPRVFAPVAWQHPGRMGFVEVLPQYGPQPNRLWAKSVMDWAHSQPDLPTVT